MAKVDVNLLANPGFVIQNDANGQVITTEMAPLNVPVGGDGWMNATSIRQTGWADLVFGNYNNEGANPLSVSPAVQDTIYLDKNNQLTGMKAAIVAFHNFITDNPVHVKRVNIRVGNVVVMPSQLIILTPNIFTGIMSRQLIDISAQRNAYQYQNDIITLDNLDLVIGRNSIVRFAGNFNEEVWSGAAGQGSQYANTPKYSMFIDWTIDRYLSLEKGLVENVKLLETATGQADAINQEINKAEAQTTPTLVLNTTDANPNFNAGVVQNTVANVRPLPQFQQQKMRR